MTKKMLAILLAVLLSSVSVVSTFADDDERGERNEKQERSYDREDDDERGERNEKNERNEKYDDEKGEKNERDERGERGEDERGEHNGSGSVDQGNNSQVDTAQRTQKVQTLKKAFAKKLGTRLDDFSQTKLETIIVVIDTKVLELEADTTMSDDKKEKLTIAYLAIKGLINDKLEELSTQDILDGLLN